MQIPTAFSYMLVVPRLFLLFFPDLFIYLFLVLFFVFECVCGGGFLSKVLFFNNICLVDVGSVSDD